MKKPCLRRQALRHAQSLGAQAMSRQRLAGKSRNATNRKHAISSLERVQEMGKPNERWREAVLL